MVLLTQPLRDEHRELFPHVEQLRTVADRVEKRRWTPCAPASMTCTRSFPII